jgi:CMP-N-acetylneuraminic acid synthetase
MNISDSDELEARAKLYESARELKRAAEIAHDSLETGALDAALIALGMWQDAVLDYLQRTGRPDPS